jgi:hypothetical protein
VVAAIEGESFEQERLGQTEEELADNRAVLGDILDSIDQIDQMEQPDYASRAGLITVAQGVAWMLGYKTGYRCSSACCAGEPMATNDQEWPVIYIDLPNGQVSWHMRAYPSGWDGHDAAVKSARIAAFVENNPSIDA